MNKVVWSPAAKTDIQNHYNYLYPFNAKSAEKAINAILKAGNSLSNSPKKGILIEGKSGLRKWPVAFGKYGFVLHYVQLNTEIVILRVYHGRQNRPY